MKTWLVILIGFVLGPLIGIPLLQAASVSQTNPLIYAVSWAMIVLSDIFMPGQDMAGLILFFPLLIIYCGLIGALFALGVRFLWKRIAT
jgi:hypothetical protein